MELNEKKIANLNKEKNIMQKYLQLIIDIGYDYDGFNSVEELKKLIDELVQYATYAKNANDKISMYENNGKKYNILGEEIK